MRVLITGSRNWTDRRTLTDALIYAWHESGEPLTVVHGAAPGADSLAAWWAAATGNKAEAHPARGPEQ